MTDKITKIAVDRPGNPEVLKVIEDDRPSVKDDQVLIKVEAAAVNRLDLQERKTWPVGFPRNRSWCPGLECSGTVTAIGSAVTQWRIGDQVCALLDEGGYAEEVTVPAKQVLPAPRHTSVTDAAGLPMAVCSSWFVVFHYGKLKKDETLFGFCELGLFSLQMAKDIGARVIVATDTQEMISYCKGLHADVCINFEKEDLVARVKEVTKKRGVDVIVKVGADNLLPYTQCLDYAGALIAVDVFDSPAFEASISFLMIHNAKIIVFDRRSLTSEDKALMVEEVKKHVWTQMQKDWNIIKYKVLPLSNAVEAHKIMETNKKFEKILLITGALENETSRMVEVRQNMWFNLCNQM